MDIDKITELLGGVDIQHPEVIRFLREYLAEGLGGVDEA